MGSFTAVTTKWIHGEYVDNYLQVGLSTKCARGYYPYFCTLANITIYVYNGQSQYYKYYCLILKLTYA